MKVTFGIINYNRLFYLKSCAESLMQSVEDYDGEVEFICIDDNSIISEFSFECKNQEKLNIWKALKQSTADAPGGKMPVVVFTKNHERDYLAIEFEDFMNILKELEDLRQHETY